ncbi:hypothetical protein [Pseudoxanthomonas sp. PXM02]|uniref:hypothetical protein n=1 Tax=Pseudoxanthomonas sp. PXM02 TaxID=2769294 RepID=UPI001781272C|nr:hypothetical protein [Pseudoxanthomonas sp. PXM02]MBD9478107.1 hypothetical protein [Pseudoxanthomonas sp. PXM02]
MNLVHLLCTALIVTYSLLLVLASRYPNARWVYWLFGYSIGPRSDVKYLTKSQLGSSSWRFLAWGGLCLVALVALVKLPQFTGWGPGAPAFTVLLFLVLVILCGMGLVGGLYLFAWYLLRSPKYVPPI